MKRIAVLLALLGAIAAFALAADPSRADSPSQVECRATQRRGEATRAEVEEQQLLVDRLNTQLAAAKDKLDAATAAHEAAVQKRAQELAVDGGAGDGGGSLQDTDDDVAKALINWNALKAQADCATKEYGERSISYTRSRLYTWAVEPAISVAGGAGGTHRLGGGLFVAQRDALFFSEVQFGATVNSFQAPPPRLGAKEPGPNPPGLEFAVQAPIRVFFGNSAVGMFLGAAPSFVDDPGHVVGAVSLEGGMRVRALSQGPPFFICDVKFFAEPWFFLDGSTTAVLFGVELGLGAGGKDTNDNKTLEWTYGPERTADDP